MLAAIGNSEAGRATIAAATFARRLPSDRKRQELTANLWRWLEEEEIRHVERAR